MKLLAERLHAPTHDMLFEIDRVLWNVLVYEELNCIETAKGAWYVVAWEINPPPTPVKPFPDNEATDISARRSIGFRSHENVALRNGLTVWSMLLNLYEEENEAEEKKTKQDWSERRGKQME